jgi:hypothetical protein
MDTSSTIPPRVETPQETKKALQGEHDEAAPGVSSTSVIDTQTQEAGKINIMGEDKKTMSEPSRDNEEKEEDAEKDEHISDHEEHCNWQELGDWQVINKDRSMIFNPNTKEYILMPSDRKEKKKVVVTLFLWFSKSIFFTQATIDMETVFKWIPKDLWNDLFTEEETRKLLRARENTLINDVCRRLVTVIDEWKAEDGFPKVPETLEEVAAARTEEQQTRHTNWFLSRIEQQTQQADAWIKYIWENVQDIMAFDPILDPNGPFRKSIVLKLAVLAESYFSSVLIGEAEARLRREVLEAIVAEQLSGMFGDLLRIHSVPPAFGTSRAGDSDDESEAGFELD